MEIFGVYHHLLRPHCQQLSFLVDAEQAQHNPDSYGHSLCTFGRLRFLASMVQSRGIFDAHMAALLSISFSSYGMSGI